MTGFDELAQVLLDRYLTLPVEEAYLDLIRQSIEDIREVLAGGRQH